MHVPYMSYVPYVTYLNVGQAFENLGARVQGRPILYKLFPAHICGCVCVCVCVCLCVVSGCVCMCVFPFCTLNDYLIRNFFDSFGPGPGHPDPDTRTRTTLNNFL
jgi:hypothetical protein